MKNLILKTVIWGTVLTLPLSSLVYASAKEQNDNSQDMATAQAICQKDSENCKQAKDGRKDRGNFKGQQLTEEQKAAMQEKAKEMLSEKLKNGKITQEQYDAAIAEIEAGKMPEILRKNGEFKGQQLTEEQKAAMQEKAKEMLSGKLKNGEITQEQYDAAIAEIEAGKMPEILRRNGGFKGQQMTEEQKAAMQEKAKETLSEKLKNGEITQEQYDAAIAEIEAGKMPEILRKNGEFKGQQMTEEQKAAMLEKAKEMLSGKLKNGEITQEQYDAAIAEIEAGKMPGILRGRGNFNANQSK